MKTYIKFFAILIVVMLSLDVTHAQISTIQYKHNVVKYYNMSSGEHISSPKNITTITYLNGDRSVYSIPSTKITINSNHQSNIPHLILQYNPTMFVNTRGVEIPSNSALSLNNIVTGESLIIYKYSTFDRGVEFQCNRRVRGTYALTARYGTALKTVAILIID